MRTEGCAAATTFHAERMIASRQLPRMFPYMLVCPVYPYGDRSVSGRKQRRQSDSEHLPQARGHRDPHVRSENFGETNDVMLQDADSVIARRTCRSADAHVVTGDVRDYECAVSDGMRVHSRVHREGGDVFRCTQSGEQWCDEEPRLRLSANGLGARGLGQRASEHSDG